MKKVLYFSACLLAFFSCEKKSNVDPVEPAQKETLPVRISPVITKVTETTFETGDAIGVSIVRSNQEAYASNEKLVFDGSVFSGSLMWYAEGTDGASITAYYPYSSTVPASFTVEADQSAGVAASDFVAGTKSGVLPSAYAVTIPFKHKLTRIVLNVTNNAGGEPTAIALKGAKLTAKIADDFSASVDPDAAAGTIVAHKVSASQYVLILPPQTVALTATVTTAGGNELSQVLQEVSLAAGKQYSISMIVNPADLKVAFSADIENWEDGGEIGGDNTLIEKLSQGYILYHEDKYTVAKMKDGKWWMTENMRYVPEGFTPSADLDNVTAGVYYPLTVVENSRAFATDNETIARNGYLYQAEVALGLKIGDIKSLEDAQALEGAQGICPKGWHVPTKTDITNLVGKGVGITTKTDAPYYDGANGSIKLLNEDGFKMFPCGMVSINNNTVTAGTLSYTIYEGRIAAGMMIGSTQNGSVTYNVNGDATSGLKNISFCGLMPMTNKATEAEYTCNGTNVSYRIAGALRCVRND